MFLCNKGRTHFTDVSEHTNTYTHKIKKKQKKNKTRTTSVNDVSCAAGLSLAQHEDDCWVQSTA